MNDIIHHESESDPENGTRFELQVTMGFSVVCSFRGRGHLEDLIEELGEVLVERYPGCIDQLDGEWLTSVREDALRENPQDADEDDEDYQQRIEELVTCGMIYTESGYISSETLHYWEL